jgi:pyruvate dehydrogenase E2 component (dihydrolipoamide acetyltransferase)
MNNVRRRTAENMTLSWTTIPHVTQYDQADITELEEFRRQYGKRVEEYGAKLTVTAILVKILAGALKRFPQFNASVDMEKGEVILKRVYNIGVAVDTDRGLIVPVIHDADRKNIVEIAIELNEKANRARERKSKLEDMQGATFTLSNLGGIGGTAFSPIVNPPEVAILGVSRSRIEPVHQDGTFVPRTMLPLSLSYDHRVIDGADGARFLRWVAEALERPLLSMLEG